MFSIADSVAQIASNVVNGPFGTAFRSPIWAAVMITTIIMLIIVSMYQKGALIKTSFYVFLATVFILFMHNKILLADFRLESNTAATHGLFTGAGNDLIVDTPLDFID